jgi:hypothetical protein
MPPRPGEFGSRGSLAFPLLARSTIARRRLPVSADTPLMWSATRGGQAYTGTGLRHCVQPLLEHCGITTITPLSPACT